MTYFFVLFPDELTLVGKTVFCLDRRRVTRLKRERLWQREWFTSARIDAGRSSGGDVAHRRRRLNSVALDFGFHFDLFVRATETFFDTFVLFDDGLFPDDVGMVGTRCRRSGVRRSRFQDVQTSREGFGRPFIVRCRATHKFRYCRLVTQLWSRTYLYP
jgi:hypothetical protein